MLRLGSLQQFEKCCVDSTVSGEVVLHAHRSWSLQVAVAVAEAATETVAVAVAGVGGGRWWRALEAAAASLANPARFVAFGRPVRIAEHCHGVPVDLRTPCLQIAYLPEKPFWGSLQIFTGNRFCGNVLV